MIKSWKGMGASIWNWWRRRISRRERKKRYL
jgi:hypothetical protein